MICFARVEKKEAASNAAQKGLIKLVFLITKVEFFFIKKSLDFTRKENIHSVRKMGANILFFLFV